MSTTTSAARSPGPWDSVHPFPHPKSSTTPGARPPREAASVGQSLPPLTFNAPLSQHKPRLPPPSRHARTPSPNYFGLQLESAEDSTSSQRGRANWSPPSSSIRSAAAASPSVVPLDQNPDLEAFRRRSETSTFTLGRLSEGGPSSQHNGSLLGENLSQSSQAQNKAAPNGSHNTPIKIPTKNGAMDDARSSLQPLSRSPKRLLSSDSTNLTGRPRRNSPASFNDADRESRSGAASTSAVRDSGFSLPSKDPVPALPIGNHRAETLPLSLDNNGLSMITPQHLMNILDSAHEEVLLLDLRVSTQYARSRISGALSLCIPTTLLKRPSFNVQKLAETFKDESERQKFERWKISKDIIVYDTASATLKDATTCVNTLKKFANDGWDGTSYVLKGGFDAFSNLFPALVDMPGTGKPAPSTKNLRLDARPEIAPVIGGCPMPATKSAANPFFGNIRQNTDLIGGVGQMPIHHPKEMTRQGFSELPLWLRQASDEKNDGKVVSEKFLHIEKREQKRMQEALSGNVTYGSPGGTESQKVQLAGIEKGSKNRYNNIWPFEHSRVRLQGVPDGGCDYINANHIQAEWSNKRYIATQGPIPATFADFWSVVWDEDVRVMVMLTAEKEGGQVKAHRYWEDKQFGPLTLHFLSEHRASVEPARIRHHRHNKSSSHQSSSHRRSTHPQNLSEHAATSNSNSSSSSSSSIAADEEPFVTVRRFSLAHANRPWDRMREITQLQYTSWPDFGAPAHPAHLLGLVEQCEAVVRATNGGDQKQRPVLVHCSAGCGRTGTFCTVDSVVDMMRRQKRWRSGQGRHGSQQHQQPQNEERQSTPMDIDRDPPVPAPGQQPKHDSFFSSSSDVISSKKTDWLHRDDVDLVEKTVEDFRLQRLSMVQSLRQFVLCYESVLEWMVGMQTPRTA
ncbi:MAG: hypothetical protein M1822_009856 [Bathelium mastoideum]|nr:MAG: hypothetical protein M1822_009856 [Bathelium mastoideum]